MEIVVAVGVDAAGTASNLYTGLNSTAAEDTIHSAGQAGAISLGYLFKLPPNAATTTLHYGPGVTTTS
jgi:hypothetical protein